VPGREFLGRAVLELAVDPRKLKLGLAAARADALRAVGDLQKGLTNIGRAMSEAGGRMTTGITLPVLAIGAAVAKVGTDFETVMKRAVGLAGVSADAIGGVKASILALGKEVGKTPQELGEAFYFVASAGFTAAEAMDVLRIAAMASAAGLGTTQDVAKVLGLVINAYGHENITAARAADILTAAVRDGTAEADAFASVLGRVVPTAATLGVSFDQVTAAIAAMTQSGLSADEAATSLNQVMVSLLKPTREAEQAMADMGLSAEGLRKQLREQGLLAVLRTLEERFAGNDEAASLVFGNVRALRGVLSLLGLDAERTQAALGIAASLASGLRQNFGTMTKPLHAGWAARNGVVAASLAQRAFTADAQALDGPNGFLRAASGGADVDPAKAVDGLGDPWEIVSPGIPTGTVSTQTWPPLQAAATLQPTLSLPRGAFATRTRASSNSSRSSFG